MRVLHAIHDYLPKHQAGSEHYAHDLATTLQQRRLQVHVVCAEYDPYRSHGDLVWRSWQGVPVTEVVNNWQAQCFEETYRCPHITEALGHVLDAVSPDVLHVHNLVNLSFDLPKLAAARGIPAVATLHEFALLCPAGGQRVRPDGGSLCAGSLCADIDPCRCAPCFVASPLGARMAAGAFGRNGPATLGRLGLGLRRRTPQLAERLAHRFAQHVLRPAVTARDIEQRLLHARGVFDDVALFVAPSQALAAEFVRFGMPSDKLRVADYGFRPLRRRSGPRAPGPMRLGFVGTIVWHKGPHVLLEAARQLPRGEFEILIHGDTETFPSYSAHLRKLASGLPVRFMGPFDRSQAAEVYGRLDVLVVPSLWLENSPLVIHEAFQSGVPVVATRLGGTAELVCDGAGGLLVPPGSASHLAAALRALLSEPDRLARLTARAPKVRTLDEDAAMWEDIYRQVALQRPQRRAVDG